MKLLTTCVKKMKKCSRVRNFYQISNRLYRSFFVRDSSLPGYFWTTRYIDWNSENNSDHGIGSPSISELSNYPVFQPIWNRIKIVPSRAFCPFCVHPVSLESYLHGTARLHVGSRSDVVFVAVVFCWFHVVRSSVAHVALFVEGFEPHHLVAPAACRKIIKL